MYRKIVIKMNTECGHYCICAKCAEEIEKTLKNILFVEKKGNL